MPNIASMLRDEIARVARKTTKTEIESLRKASAEQRRHIAQLRREIAALAKQLKAAGRRSNAQSSTAVDAEEESRNRLRFSAKGLAKKRQQLGLSAADMAKLLGVSALSVYKWESGKTRPRNQQLQAIAAVRGLGKREAAARLAQMP